MWEPSAIHLTFKTLFCTVCQYIIRTMRQLFSWDQSTDIHRERNLVSTCSLPSVWNSLAMSSSNHPEEKSACLPTYGEDWPLEEICLLQPHVQACLSERYIWFISVRHLIFQELSVESVTIDSDHWKQCSVWSNPVIKVYMTKSTAVYIVLYSSSI